MVAIETPEIVVRRDGRALGVHRCSAFCRGADHVELCWHPSAELPQVERAARMLLDLYGVEFVGIGHASPEARPAEKLGTLDAVTGRPVRFDLAYARHGYLVTWRERVPS